MYCLYNDHIKRYETCINVSKMQKQMFEMSNPKVVKREIQKSVIVDLLIYNYFIYSLVTTMIF